MVQNIQVMARVWPMLAKEVGEIEAVQVGSGTLFVATDSKAETHSSFFLFKFER
jgi:hypothetical protein